MKDKSIYEDLWVPRRAECPLLISLHKSGSTWVFSYIHKYYRQMGITMPPNNIYSEFLRYTARRNDSFNLMKWWKNCKIWYIEKITMKILIL